MHEEKRHLLRCWFERFGDGNTCRLIQRGESLRDVGVGAVLARLEPIAPAEEAIYVLLIDEALDESVPVYVGKATNMQVRWRQHLTGLLKGRGSYASWHALILDEASAARHDVYLLVVPRSGILTPPIPGFPTTVGSVEYQLVGLISDAYPGSLLNREGNRR